MPDSSYAAGAGTAQEKAERKRLLSDRGQAVALMHFDHIERQVALAVTKASLLVAASAFIVGAYVRVVVDFRVFSFLGSADLSKAVLVIGGACLMSPWSRCFPSEGAALKGTRFTMAGSPASFWTTTKSSFRGKTEIMSLIEICYAKSGPNHSGWIECFGTLRQVSGSSF